MSVQRDFVDKGQIDKFLGDILRQRGAIVGGVKKKVSRLGKTSFKKKRNFMKKFQKTVTPPPRTAFMKSLFRFFTVNELVYNMIYEI